MALPELVQVLGYYAFENDIPSWIIGPYDTGDDSDLYGFMTNMANLPQTSQA